MVSIFRDKHNTGKKDKSDGMELTVICVEQDVKIRGWGSQIVLMKEVEQHNHHENYHLLSICYMQNTVVAVLYLHSSH